MQRSLWQRPSQTKSEWDACGAVSTIEITPLTLVNRLMAEGVRHVQESSDDNGGR